MKTSTRSFVTSLLIAALAMPAAPVQAESFATAAALAGDRERIAAVLARADVQAQLQAHGVDAAEANARVAALSDEEAAQLAAHIDELPAGGHPILAMVGYGLYAVVVVTVAVAVLAVAGAVALVKKARS